MYLLSFSDTPKNLFLCPYNKSYNPDAHLWWGWKKNYTETIRSIVTSILWIKSVRKILMGLFYIVRNLLYCSQYTILAPIFYIEAIFLLVSPNRRSYFTRFLHSCFFSFDAWVAPPCTKWNFITYIFETGKTVIPIFAGSAIFEKTSSEKSLTWRDVGKDF